jgi:hypothetical protein
MAKSEQLRSKLGPIPEDAFEGDVEYKPDVDKSYGQASAARMKALREKLAQILQQPKDPNNIKADE